MENLESIRRINKDLIKPDGTVKSFKEQLLEYEYGLYPYNKPLIVLTSSECININSNNVPLTINQTIIEKIKSKHEIHASDLIDLDRLIQENVLILQSKTRESGLLAVLNKRDNQDKTIIVAIHMDEQQNEINVHKIRSVYGKNDIQKLIISTYQEGLSIYPNKKTEHWIKSIRLQLPKEIINVLSTNYSMSQDEKSQEKSVLKVIKAKGIFSEKDVGAKPLDKEVIR
jgi:hypothetical protein